MANEPISLLTQIAAPTGTPPYPTAFTSPTLGAMLEILDPTNTSMASTGTNSKIAPGDLIKGFLNAGTNVTLTETAGIVTIAASGGGFSLITPGILSANVNLTTSYATLGSGLTVTLPTAGTYLLLGNYEFYGLGTGSSGNALFVNAQLYNTTTSTAVPNSFSQAGFYLTASGTPTYQLTIPMAPTIYTITGTTQIDLQANYGNVGGLTSVTAQIVGGNTITNMSAIRIA